MCEVRFLSVSLMRWCFLCDLSSQIIRAQFLCLPLPVHRQARRVLSSYGLLLCLSVRASLAPPLHPLRLCPAFWTKVGDPWDISSLVFWTIWLILHLGNVEFLHLHVQWLQKVDMCAATSTQGQSGSGFSFQTGRVALASSLRHLYTFCSSTFSVSLVFRLSS